MTQVFVQGVFSFLAFACFIGFFYTAWQSLVVDAVRQRMFEIRDSAFLWAYDNGRIEDDAYKQFRDSANMFIRHYEHLSVPKLFVLNKIFKLDAKKTGAEHMYPRDTPLGKNFEELVKVAARGLIIRSLFFLILFCVLLPLAVPVVGFLSLLSHKEPVTRRIENKVTNTLSREIKAEFRWAAAT